MDKDNEDNEDNNNEDSGEYIDIPDPASQNKADGSSDPIDLYLKEIASIPLLNESEEKEIAKRVSAGDDLRNRPGTPRGRETGKNQKNEEPGATCSQHGYLASLVYDSKDCARSRQVPQGSRCVQ